MLKIPYGIIDYRTLIEEGYYYVDKTMYLEKLENFHNPLIYLRPGRFGKTLFTSMMSYYYDVKSEYLFNSLFKNTYVYDKPTKNKNNYYILKLDFSGISSAGMNNKELEVQFIKKIIDGISKFNIDYKVNASTDILNETPNSLLIKFLSYFRSLELEHKLYIIIDEYDNFTNAILEGNGDRFKNVVGNEGFVKAFYASIKEYYGLGIVDRVFITGICPITLDSMTSGFNIATDISCDIEFNSMIGLTHNEVRKLISNVEKDKQEEIFNLMIDNYDGYLFNKDSNERVFNATLVMYFLREYNRFNTIPGELLDTNIAFNYGKLGNLLKLQNNKYYLDILDKILTKDEITGRLKNKFNLEENFDQDDIISLLYYFGYLTIDRQDEITEYIIFKIPNYVTSKLYNNYFLKILKDNNINIDTSIITESVKEIVLEGKIDKITNYISEILKYQDNRLFINYDEKYIQVLYNALLFNNRNYNIYTEYPTKNGYIDLMILKNSDICKYNIMIELKYIKKNDYSDNIIELKKKEAIEQLNKYSDDERFNKDTLKKYVVIFVGNNVKLIEEA